jgi:fumarate reductase subunit C
MIQPTEYLPRSYHARISTYWWLASWRYLKFVVREASSVFVAWAVVIMLLQIRALTRGPAAYAGFQKWLQSPPVLALSALTFFFVLFHAVTWFNLAPKAMVIRLREKRLPNVAVAAPIYIIWVLISALVAWLVLRG